MSITKLGNNIALLSKIFGCFRVSLIWVKSWIKVPGIGPKWLLQTKVADYLFTFRLSGDDVFLLFGRICVGKNKAHRRKMAVTIISHRKGNALTKLHEASWSFITALCQIKCQNRCSKSTLNCGQAEVKLQITLSSTVGYIGEEDSLNYLIIWNPFHGQY